MANMVYDLVDPAELLEYVRAYDNEVLREEARIVLDQYLPNERIEDLEFRIRKGSLVDVDAAQYRSWDTPARMIGRQGTSRISGSLAPLSQQIPLGEEEMHRVRILQGGTNNPLISQIYDDAELMLRSVQVRVELARGDIINDGKVTISENGITLEADFGRDASMSVTAGTVWSNPAATILTELLGWMEDYTDLNGIEPDHILMPKVRVGQLALNTELRQYAAANGTTPTRINRQTIDSIFAAEGLPPIRVYDGQFRVDGVRTRVLPVHKCFFMPPANEPLGKTYYGPTAEAIKLAEKGYIKAEATPGVVAVVTSTDDPVQTFTKAAAVALPAMPNPDLIMDMSVVTP